MPRPGGAPSSPARLRDWWRCRRGTGSAQATAPVERTRRPRASGAGFPHCREVGSRFLSLLPEGGLLRELRVLYGGLDYFDVALDSRQATKSRPRLNPRSAGGDRGQLRLLLGCLRTIEREI